jgi:WD40 repeat protein/serine/threonine protein kinase
MSPCIAPDQFQRMLAEQLTAADHQALDAHVETCSQCQQTLERLLNHGQGDTTADLWLRPNCANNGSPALPPFLRELQQHSPDLTATAPERLVAGEPSLLHFPDPPTARGPLGRLGAYHIVSALGHGGFGHVFNAYDENLDCLVALKVLKPELATNPADRTRFENEAAKAATVQHDHVIRVYHVGSTPGFPLPYFVMEYIDGGSLSERLKSQQLLPPRAAAEIARQVALGLAAAHERGLIHRDIKSANILLERSTGRAKIADFGLARLLEGAAGITQSQGVVGTPAYMSPEQITSPSRIDPRSDIYSLGVVLYESLTGMLPFRGLSHLVLHQVIHDEPRPLRELNDGISRDLETICLKCLAKEPARRYASAQSLADDLARWLGGKPIDARPVSKVEHAWSWCRRNPLVAALTLAASVSLLAGSLISTYFAVEAHVEADAAILEKNNAARETTASRAAEKKAKQERLNTRRALYAASMHLAHQAWWDNHIRRVKDLLDDETFRPTVDDPLDLRGWEWFYLRGLCHKDVRTLDTGSHGMVSVAFDKEGERVAVASHDATVRVWNADTGQIIHVLKGHKWQAEGAVFMPNGRQLASCGLDGTVKLWDLATGEQVFSFIAHPGGVRTVAISPNGENLASCGEDPLVKLWDLAGKNLQTFRGHTAPVMNVVFSTDGRYLASCGQDKTARLWEASTGKLIHTFVGHKFQVSGIAFGPNGLTLVTSSEDNTLKLWDTVSGEEIRTLVGHTAWAYGVAFSADGHHIASASQDYTVKLWDAADGREIATFRGHAIFNYAVTFRPNSRQLVSAGMDGTVKFWDRDAGPQQVRNLSGHVDRIHSVAFSPDNQWLASGSKDRTVRLWDVAHRKPPIILKGHTSEVVSVAFSPNSPRLAAGCADGTVSLWDLTNQQRTPVLPAHQALVYSLSFSADGRWLASASHDKTVKIWNMSDATLKATLNEHSDRVPGVHFSSDSRLLATASHDGTVILWETVSWKRIGTLKGNGLIRKPQCVAFHPDGKTLAVGGQWDESIEIWDTVSGKMLRTLKGHANSVYSLAFSPDGTRLASGGADMAVKLWDPVSGHEVLTLKGHTSIVYSVVFSPDGRALASAGAGDYTVKLWQTPAPEK